MNHYRYFFCYAGILTRPLRFTTDIDFLLQTTKIMKFHGLILPQKSWKITIGIFLTIIYVLEVIEILC